MITGGGEACKKHLVFACFWAGESKEPGFWHFLDKSIFDPSRLIFFDSFIFSFFIFLIFIFTFWPFLEHFWALWSSETERGGEISMDRPVLSCKGAPGAELGPIWPNMGRKRSGKLEPEARVGRRMWPVRLSSRWACSEQNSRFRVQEVLTIQEVQEIQDPRNPRIKLRRVHY